MKKKLISLIFVPALALLSSCEQSNEQKANQLFVEGAIKANLAMENFAESNVKGALLLLEESLANCDKILLEYPETNIAVNLVSDRDINLGLLSYVDIRRNLLPELKNLSVSIDKYGDLGEVLYKSDKAKLKEAFAYFYDWREPDYAVKSNITKEDIIHFAGRDFVQSPILSPLSTEVSNQEQKNLAPAKDITMEDLLKLSNQVKMNVGLVAHEKEAIEFLYKVSEDIAVYPDFANLLEPHMAKIKENIARITLPEVREKAYCVLSKIFTNMNKSMAMNVALFDIKNEELSAEALTFYVDKLISQGNLKMAMELLAYIKVPSVKDDVAVEIAMNVANIDAVQALEILLQCTNEEKRKDAIIKICAENMTEENLDFYAEILLNSTDTLSKEDLEVFALRLNAFNKVMFKEKSDAYYDALILGELAKLFSKYGKDFSQNLGVKIINSISQTEDAKEQAEILNIVFDTVLYLDATKNTTLEFSGFKKYLSEEEWQNVYLKFAVAQYLKGYEKEAKRYLDMLNMDIVDEDYLKIALLKANRTKAEINTFLKN